MHCPAEHQRAGHCHHATSNADDRQRHFPAATGRIRRKKISPGRGDSRARPSLQHWLSTKRKNRQPASLVTAFETVQTGRCWRENWLVQLEATALTFHRRECRFSRTQAS